MIFCLIFCYHVLVLLGYIHFKSLSFFFISILCTSQDLMRILAGQNNCLYQRRNLGPDSRPYPQPQEDPLQVTYFQISVIPYKKSVYLHIWIHTFISLRKFVLYFCSFLTLGWFAMTSFFHQYIFFYFVFHLYADFNQSS